jgi:hypothetical protein
MAAGLLGLAGLAGCEAGPQLLAAKSLELTQENAERAGRGADFAAQQTCAAAEPYRQQAMAHRDQAQQMSRQAQTMNVQLNQATALQGQIETLRTEVSEARTAYVEAMDELRAAHTALNSYYENGNLKDTARIAPLMQRTDDVVRAYGRAADSFQVIADAISDVANTQALTDLLPPGSVQNGSPVTDIAAVARNVQEQADAVAQGALDLSHLQADAERRLPADRNLMVQQLSVPLGWDQRDEFRRAMRQLAGSSNPGGGLAGASPSALNDAINSTTRYLHQGQSMVSGAIYDLAEQAKEMADETRRHAAEANRNALLAYRECHQGQLPPGIEQTSYDLDSPFDYALNPYPRWNSTFWDISSP